MVPGGEWGIFIKESLNYIIREDISVFIPHVFESAFIEIQSQKNRNTVLNIIYRPNSEPRADICSDRPMYIHIVYCTYGCSCIVRMGHR